MDGTIAERGDKKMKVYQTLITLRQLKMVRLSKNEKYFENFCTNTDEIIVPLIPRLIQVIHLPQLPE